MEANNTKTYILPSSILSKSDVTSLLSELTELNEAYDQAALRNEKPGLSINEKLIDIASANGLNIEENNDRKIMIKFLNKLIEHAPSLHISFSSEPGLNFKNKLIDWFRNEIHPMCLVSIGLAPDIGVGSILRTTNKYFNLGIRERLNKDSEQLLNAIKEVNSVKVEA